MKHLVAPLAMLALVGSPACGGDREQTPGPQSPPGATATETSMGETMTTTATATETATATSPPPAPKASLLDLQRDAIKTMAAAFNAHDSRKIASLYAADTKIAGPGPAGWVEQTGTAAVEEAYNRLFTAFPDMQWASPRVYVQHAVVIQEWALAGTQRGALGSIAATNKPAGAHGAAVYWFDEDGRIRRQHTYYDPGAIGAQLGTAKVKTRAVPMLPAGEPQFIVATGMAEDNRFVDEASAFYKAVNDQDEKAYLGTFGKDATRSSYLMPEDRKGERAAREDFRGLVRAFPDVKMTPQNMWGFGDRVITEITMTGTQAHDYHSMKATKKPATLHTLDILRFDQDGKVAEVVSYGTLLELSPPGAPPGAPGHPGQHQQKPRP